MDFLNKAIELYATYRRPSLSKTNVEILKDGKRKKYANNKKKSAVTIVTTDMMFPIKIITRDKGIYNLKSITAKHDRLKGEIDNSTIIVEDFNTPLSLIDRPTGHKISKEIENLNNILNRVNQTLTENSTQKQTHILSSMFFRIDHLLGHKTNLRKAIRTEIIQSMFSNHNG